MAQRKGPSGPKNPILIRLYESCAAVRANFQEAYQYTAIAVRNRGIFYQTTLPGTDTLTELSPYLDAGSWAFILEERAYAQFAYQGAPPYHAGTVYWDGNSWNCQTEFSDVTLQLGEENQILVVNKEPTDTILNGQVIYASGAQGQRLATLKFSNGLTNARKVLGLATHQISKNQNGRCTNFGLVRELNTQGLAVAEPVYSTDTPGLWSQTQPPGDVEAVQIGILIQAHPTDGSIFVYPRVLERLSGTTANRPSAPRVGATYFDSTLGIPIWCKSLGPDVWVNASGVPV